MSRSNCCFLICIQISQEVGQVVWYSHLLKNFPEFFVIHTIKGLDIVDKAIVGVFLELSCFFNDLTDVGNLIFGSFAFSRSSLNIWKLMVHVLLKPRLEHFEHHFTSVWDECNCAVVWASLALPFFGIGMKTDPFQSCGHCWVFQICWHIECITFTASSFRFWNSPTGILSPPLLALFLVNTWMTLYQDAVWFLVLEAGRADWFYVPLLSMDSIWTYPQNTDCPSTTPSP